MRPTRAPILGRRPRMKKKKKAKKKKKR